MQRKFLTSLILLLALNLLIKPFWILGIDRAVQNTLGSQEYGFYFAILNFSFLLNILLDFGITNFNNRNIARHSHMLDKHFPALLVLKLLLASVYFIVSFAAALIIGYRGEQLTLLAMLGTSQFLLHFILYLRSNISGLQLFKTDSLMSVLDRLLMIGFCAWLLWGNTGLGPFSIKQFVWAQVLAYLLTAITAFVIVVRKAHFKKLSWSWPFTLVILRQSAPFAILVLLMSFYNRIDSVMIERLLPGDTGDIQAGIYASAYRLLDATNMIAYLFSVILLPLFSRMLKQKQEVVEVARLAFTLLIAAATIIAFASFFYAEPIIEMLYHHHVTESAEVFRLLMFGFMAISTTYVFGTLLTANGNLMHLNIMAACGMVFNILINIILIPRFMAMGAVYASLITQFATAITQVILAKIIIGFTVNYRYLAKMLLFMILTGFTGYLSTLLPWRWEIKLLCMLPVAIALLQLLRFLRIRQLIEIVRKEE